MKSKLKKIGMLALFLVGGGTSFMGDSINNKVYATTYSALPCKIYREDCPGWFQGDRDRCMTQGNSLTCQCGQQDSVCY